MTSSSQTALIETLQRLLAPSDVVIWAILLGGLFLGCYRGLFRTLFDLLSRLAALVLAGAAAQALAPLMARHFVLPIVGDVFEKQAGAVLRQAGDTGAGDLAGFLASLPGELAALLDQSPLQAAAEPLADAAGQLAWQMARGLSFFLLFFILFAAFSALLKIIAEAFEIIKRKAPPVDALNALAGGLLGLAAAFALCVLILLALGWFAPTVYTELGVLSPAQVEKTLLTQGILRLIRPSLFAG